MNETYKKASHSHPTPQNAIWWDTPIIHLYPNISVKNDYLDTCS